MRDIIKLLNRFIFMKIRVVVTPNAKAPSVEKIDEESYKVKVDARPTEGRANIRLVQILAEHFGASKSKVIILKGVKGREKLVEILI